jgi:hypothetical protein
MAGKIALVSVGQTDDGQALGTFDYEREGYPTLRFQQAFPGAASEAEIGKTLMARCMAILSADVVPAVPAVEKMFATGPRLIPDPQPASPAS